MLSTAKTAGQVMQAHDAFSRSRGGSRLQSHKINADFRILEVRLHPSLGITAKSYIEDG